MTEIAATSVWVIELWGKNLQILPPIEKRVHRCCFSEYLFEKYSLKRVKVTMYMYFKVWKRKSLCYFPSLSSQIAQNILFNFWSNSDKFQLMLTWLLKYLWNNFLNNCVFLEYKGCFMRWRCGSKLPFTWHVISCHCLFLCKKKKNLAN